MSPIKFILVGLLLFAFENLKGQIKIQLSDGAGNPLEGALVKCGAVQKSTNSDGYVTLAPEQKKKEAMISLPGYESQTLLLDSDVIHVQLSPEGVVLKELIISSDLFRNKKKETSGSISFIQKRELELADQTSFPTILNTVPGLYMHSGALNTNRITIRGVGSRSLFSTNKIKAYLDEIPLSSGEGETTIEDIDLTTLDHIEVLRGPASSLYGAGLGGTINMTSRAPHDEHRLSSELMTGSFGLIRSNTAYSLGDGNRGISIIHQKIHSDGYRQNNEYDREGITLLGKIGTANNWRFTTYMNLTSLKAFIPSSLDQTTFDSNPEAAARNWLDARGFEDNDKFRLGLSMQKSISHRIGMRIAFFYNSRESFEVRPFNILKESSNNVGMRGLIFWDVTENGQLEAVVGSEVFYEKLDQGTFDNDQSIAGTIQSDFDQTRNYSNTFGALEYKPNQKWSMSLGLNLNHSNYESEDQLKSNGADLSANYAFSSILSPKIGINHYLNSNTSLYALWSHGYSLPTFDETLNPDGLINTDIQPETGYNYELGIKGTGFNEKFYFEVSVYSLRVSDLLVARRVTEDDFIGVNAGKTIHNGLELTANHILYQSTIWTIDHQVNFSWNNYYFDDFIDDNEDFSGNDLTGVPDYNASYIFNINYKNFIFTNINWHSTGSMPIRDDNSIYTESYNVVNIKSGFKKNFGKLSGHIYVGINNILDEKYASMILINAGSFGGRPPRYFYPGLPLNWYGGLKVLCRL